MATQAKSQTKGQPGPTTRPIIVDVWAWIDATDKTVQFDHEWRFLGDPNGTKGKIDVVQGSPATPIKFQFRDDTEPKLKLKFYPTPPEAMWVDFAPTCPAKAGNGGGQIILTPPDASSSPNLLKVVDINTVACELKYSLRFDGDPYQVGAKQYPPYEYDPDLRNGGGTKSALTATTIALVGLGILALAIALFVWTK